MPKLYAQVNSTKAIGDEEERLIRTALLRNVVNSRPTKIGTDTRMVRKDKFHQYKAGGEKLGTEVGNCPNPHVSQKLQEQIVKRKTDQKVGN